MKINIRSPKNLRIIIAVAILAALVVIALILYFCLRPEESYTTSKPRGVVVANGNECAQIGGKILERGGSAVDAAIATLFCEGAVMPQACGLGGGFLMTVYKKDSGQVRYLNARETAPACAKEDMFKTQDEAQRGGKAIAVPAELKGAWAAYEKYGVLKWSDLVEPTIRLCENGIRVSKYHEKMFVEKFHLIQADEILSKYYINPETRKTYMEGDIIKRPDLAKTFRTIANEGGNAIHNGSLTDSIVKEIQARNGCITTDDLNNYQPKWEDPIITSLFTSNTLYTAPLPGSGAVLAHILSILNGFITNDYDLLLNWHKIIESFKFGYGKRTLLGDDPSIAELVKNMTDSKYVKEIQAKIYDDKTFNDPAYYGAETVQPEDHGTAHISVLAPNGDAVSLTSTINLYFGAGFASKSTGIVFNDQMDDFSSPSINSSFGIPPSRANFIKPGKRPLSSMCPSIIVGQDGNVKMVVGAAGGTKITTSVAVVILKHLWFGMDLKSAMDDHRLHHQLFPMEAELEISYQNEPLVQFLKDRGHKIGFLQPTGFSAVTSISQDNNGVKMGMNDKRRSGNVYYVN